MQGPGIHRSMFYDAKGERLVVRDGTTYTFTLRDLGQQVLREVSWSQASGFQWGKDYVYRDGVLLASHSLADGLRYHFPDHLTSPRLVANRCGERVIEHRTSSFGVDLPSGGAQSPDRMRFTMHERDLGSLSTTLDDLDVMHARTYWPSLGRFTSVDPGRDYDFSHPQSFNLYAYVRNNPVTLTDPDGRKVLVKDAAAMAYIQSTLPEEVRQEITLDKKGFIHKKTINKIKSDNPNFKALKELVNAKAIIEVATSIAATYKDSSGKIVTKPFFFDPSTTPPWAFLGLIATPRGGTNPFDSGGVYSLSGNISIQLAHFRGLPKVEIQKTTAHELYGHALLYIQGRPFEHPHQDVDAYIREIEERFGP